MLETGQNTAADASSKNHRYYLDHGYVVVRGLIPHVVIDGLLDSYRSRILPSKTKFYRQSKGFYTRNDINEFGYVKDSFLDIHDYSQFPEFSLRAKDLFFCDPMMAALREVTGHTSHNLMQTMLFDANTATCPHQDWWYLDTVPAGNLLGAWIAMEDIREEAGRFYVIPKTTGIDFREGDSTLPHSEWLKRIKTYFDENRDKVTAPDLKKGDVLFWNSRTIHGALETRDPRFSRKSLTAHYIPSGFKFGNLFLTKDFIKYKTYKGHRFFRNQPDYSLKNRLKNALKVGIYDRPVLMKLVREIQKRVQ